MKSHQGFNPEYSEAAPSIEAIKAIEGYAILEFGSAWCGHCDLAAPLVQGILSNSDYPHIKVQDGKGKSLGRFFEVKLWPTLILLKDGEELTRVVRPTQVSDIEKIFDLTQANS